MRSELLCILLVLGSSTPILGQQLKAITNSLGTKLVLIHAGSFSMGSPEGETGRQGDEPLHEETFGKSFYLGVYETTQDEFEKVMGNNPSRFRGPKNPVEHLSWEVAVLYCDKLSQLPEEKAAGRAYRLPTESEWEYACRAISTTSYCSGETEDELATYAWFSENSGMRTHPVGEKAANRWGLYDMHGNVWEWCQDVYKRLPSDEASDPQGKMAGTSRVFRGGGWIHDVIYCRSALRMRKYPSYHHDYIGFRVAMSLPVNPPGSLSVR